MSSEMQKMDFTISQSLEQRRETEKLQEKLLHDPDVIKLSTCKKIDMKVLLAHPWKVEVWRQGIQCCKGCNGLAGCRSSLGIGYQNMLAYDGVLKIVQSACPFKQNDLARSRHLRQYMLNMTLPATMRQVTIDAIPTQGDKDYDRSLGQLIGICDSPRGAYIYGTLGIGKTYLAAAACNTAAEQGMRVAFVVWPEFVEEMKKMIITGEYYQYIDKLKRAQFAVIDDLGAEAVTDWNRDQLLFSILNARYEAGLPTWITSNEDLKSLEDHFRVGNKGSESLLKAKRIVERIRAMCDIIELKGKYRR